MAEDRKLVTVLFADVVGSTALSEGLDPERLRNVLDRYFAAMVAVLEAYGGTVEKFIGDAIVAMFGVPAVREDDAERALRAGLEMLERLQPLNRELGADHGVELQIRIGVNTGEVLATTEPGLNQRLVSGDAVNVAARLQEAAQPGSVLAGERTWLATRGAFEFADAAEVQLKGKAQPVQARRVLRPLSDPVRGAGLSAPMVGRQLELQLLQRLLEEVIVAGQPRLVTIVGQAGLGKTRLVREFVSLVRERYPDALVLRGRCLSTGDGITYWALAEILRAACGVSLDEPAEASAAKLRGFVGGALQAAGAEAAEADLAVHALALSAGVRLPHERLSGLDAPAVAEELGRAWPKFASALCARGLAVLVVEDLHWAGDAMVEMLERIATRSAGPLLVLATARPEFRERYPGFGGASEDFSVVSLRALSRQETLELVDALAASVELPEAARTGVVERAGGNPYFIEELLQRLLDTETVPAGAPPETLQALLAARIDTLPKLEKQVLQGASIVGQVFWEQPLAGNDPQGVHRALLELERRGLIHPHLRSSLRGTAEFSFKHILLRDVAYSSVPKARRARAHAETARWIAELAGDRRGEFIELIAYHSETAAGPDAIDLAWPNPVDRERIRAQAFEHLLAAGTAAGGRAALSRAVELHERAREYAGGEADRRRASEAAGDDHAAAYHGDAAAERFREALTVAPDPEDRARLLGKLAGLMASRPGAFSSNPDAVEVDALISDGLDLAEQPVTRGRLLVARAEAARLWGAGLFANPGPGQSALSVEERVRAGEEGLEIGRQLGDRQLLSDAEFCLLTLYGTVGRHDDALKIAQGWLGRLDQLTSPLERADLLRGAAALEAEVGGDYQTSLRHALEAHELSAGSNPHHRMHVTYAVLQAMYALGRWADMAPYVDEHLAAFQEDPAVLCGSVRDGVVLGALACLESGQPERAAEIAARLGDPRRDLAGASARQALYSLAAGEVELALKISLDRAHERSEHSPRHSHPALEALVALGRWDEVSELLPLARQRREGYVLLGPVCTRAEALMEAAKGDADSATALFREALQGFERLGVVFEAARTGQLLAARVDPEERRRLREAALEIYVRLGAAPHAERLRNSLV